MKAIPSFDDGRRLRRLALGSIEDPSEFAVDLDDEEPIALAQISHEVLMRRLRQ